MLRVLVVEDQEDFYENYLVRIFTQLLPMEKISLTHAPNLQAGLVALAEEPWDAVLMDFALGPKFSFHNHPVRDGTDLVAFRRAVEERSDGTMPRTLIWGIGANRVSNHLLIEAGADGYHGKDAVVEIARDLSQLLKGQTKAAPPEKKPAEEKPSNE